MADDVGRRWWSQLGHDIRTVFVECGGVKIDVVRELCIRVVVGIATAVALCFVGGLCFRIIEGWHEVQVKCSVQRTRHEIVTELWEKSVYLDADVWRTLARDRLGEYEAAVQKAIKAGVESKSTRRVWSLSGALYYVVTVVTSIGYGNVVPSTDAGRTLTIAYACIGIPLLLTVLADLGKVFTRGIKYVWAFVRRFYYTCSCRRVRSVIQLQAMERLVRGNRHEIEDSNPAPFVVDENFDLPVSLALLMLFSYILLGALMIMQWEDQWNYFHAVYFIFISLTTIGFGDLVPEHPAYLMITFIYLLFGLALTSMCINVVQESISNTFAAATNKLTTRIGLLSTGPSSRDLSQVEIVGVHQKRKSKDD